MLQIAICDNDTGTTAEIEKLLRSCCMKKQTHVNIDVFFDGQTLCKQLESHSYYDLIYLDIEMEYLDGIQTAHLIRDMHLSTLLIYVSAYDIYFRQIIETEPFRFLSKPIEQHLFYKYFDAAYKKILSQGQLFTFCFNQNCYKVLVSEIIYFESKGRYIIVHTEAKTYRFIGKLNIIEEETSIYTASFLRIHQSFLVNPFYIRVLSLTSVRLKNNLTLPISLKYRVQIRTQYLGLVEEL